MTSGKDAMVKLHTVPNRKAETPLSSIVSHVAVSTPVGDGKRMFCFNGERHVLLASSRHQAARCLCNIRETNSHKGDSVCNIMMSSAT